VPNEAAELLDPEGADRAARPFQDGRTAALLRLKLFVSLLRFFREGDRGGPPVEFRVPLANVLEEWPDDEKAFKLPAVAFLPGEGIEEPLGLGGPVVCESTVGKYGPGTVVEESGVYREDIGVEAWGGGKAERRGLMAGLKAAFTSGSSGYSIRLKLPDYLDQIATFTLTSSRYFEEPDAVKGRRRASLTLAMSVPAVRLVRYPTLRTFVGVSVRDRGFCEDGEAVAEVEV
jgi:hypothetical protein